MILPTLERAHRQAARHASRASDAKRRGRERLATRKSRLGCIHLLGDSFVVAGRELVRLRVEPHAHAFVQDGVGVENATSSKVRTVGATCQIHQKQAF